VRFRQNPYSRSEIVGVGRAADNRRPKQTNPEPAVSQRPAISRQRSWIRNFARPPSNTTSRAGPGKISVTATKQLVNQRDLALAYSPGVAAACEEIVADPAAAFRYTSRGNLVGGGHQRHRGARPGQYRAAGGQAGDGGQGGAVQEVRRHRRLRPRGPRTTSTSWSIIIAALEPTFGGINLEDIKAPDCFYVERKLRERMKIPVFHDDQHGTAIVVGAAMLNGLSVVGKDIARSSWCAAAPAPRRSPAWTCSSTSACRWPTSGSPTWPVWSTAAASELMDPDKERFAQPTEASARSTEIIGGADVFLGLSAAGVLKPSMVAKMAAIVRWCSRWPTPRPRSCPRR
jgi:malate dehydrogenase (oxaloacetate-decarboxylating)(NADP+)